jgi:LuxR family transcriptional regulator of spore coat protein
MRVAVPTRKALSETDVARLTRREHQCLLAAGETVRSKEIGAALGIAPKTVDKHIENACRKLGLANRLEAGRALLAFHGLRNGSVEAPFPLFSPLSDAPEATAKGDRDAAFDRIFADLDLGRSGGDFRQSGANHRGEGHRPPSPDDDARDGAPSLEARFAARDHLYRARVAARERSTAGMAVASPERRPVLREIAVMTATTLLIGALLAGALGAAGNLQVLVQHADRALRGR